MVIGKIKPVATIVAQFPASVEVEAIMHEGKVFMPVMSLGEFSPKEVAPTPAKGEKSAPSKKEPAPAEDEEGEEEAVVYTEKELMDMETKELEKILKDEFEVNPDDYPGKNTNKKLRKLILDAQEGDSEEEEAAAPKKTAKAAKPAKVEDADDEPSDDAPEDEAETLQSSVATMLEDFDGGKMNKKKTVSRIAALVEGSDSDEILKTIEDFENDSDADIDETAEAIVGILEGKTKKKKPADKKAVAKKTKETLVEPEDLEVDQKVSVYWEDQEEWYDGVVKSIKKGKVKVAYDDGTEEFIDENNTKIKLL